MLRIKTKFLENLAYFLLGKPSLERGGFFVNF